MSGNPKSATRNPQSLRVLLVEDSEHDAKLLVRELKSGGFGVAWERVDSETTMRATFESSSWDLIVCDYNVPGFGALPALALCGELGLHTPFIVVSGAVGEAAAVECMRRGAHDFLMKDRLVRLCEAVRRELREAETRRRRREAEDALQESTRRLATLMANLPGMAYRCANTRDWPMDFVSEGCLALTGYRANELMGRDRRLYGDLIHPDDRQMVWDCVQDAVSRGGRFVVEYRLIDKKEQTRWVWEQGQAVGTDRDRALILEGFITDITDRKRAEQQLQDALAELRSVHDRVSAENVLLREKLRMGDRHGDIVARSDAMKTVLVQAEQVAETDSTVLILGETGTGKELLARAIHDMSTRRDKPLITVNCATIPAALVESELFGREKGAYTGAVSRQIGRFEAADTGTLFLDEVGELPLETQPKLLRVLQEGRFERLGSTDSVKVDVRVVTATNRNVERDVREGRFREDLFFRLNVFPITIPPLRERADDVEPLVWKFVREFATRMGKPVEAVSQADMARLRAHPWPGNVRELRNVVERAMIAAQGPTLGIRPPRPAGHAAGAYRGLTLDDVQRRHILTVLKQTRWRVRGDAGAAQILGLKPTTLESRMQKLGIRRHSTPSDIS